MLVLQILNFNNLDSVLVVVDFISNLCRIKWKKKKRTYGSVVRLGPSDQSSLATFKN